MNPRGMPGGWVSHVEFDDQDLLDQQARDETEAFVKEALSDLGDELRILLGVARLNDERWAALREIHQIVVRCTVRAMKLMGR